MVAFAGPWAYGIGGLGEGLAQGLFMGLQNAREKRREEQEKQARAMQLLLGVIKAGAEDPEAIKPWLSQIAPMLPGGKVPEFASSEQRIGREVGTVDATITALSKAHPDWSPDFVRQAAMAMRGIKLPKQDKPAPPTFMRGASGELIPLEPGTRVVGGSGYPPAWTQPQTYQPVDAYGQPAGPPLHMGGRDKPLVTPWAKQETKPLKEPKPKSQKELNYEMYVKHMSWIDQNFPEGDPSKAAQRQIELKKAMKRAARLGIISPKMGEMGGEED